MPHVDGFWLGMAAALPVYWILDHHVIPYLVDRKRHLQMRTVRVRSRGR